MTNLDNPSWQFLIRIYGPVFSYRAPMFRKGWFRLPLLFGWSIQVGVYDLFHGTHYPLLMIVTKY